jgi:hypothetical protein
MPTYARRLLGENPLTTYFQAELGGLSIYQPRNWRGQGRIPRFSGFFAGFLEMTSSAVAESVYVLC